MQLIDAYGFLINDDFKKNRVSIITSNCGKIFISKKWFLKTEPSLLSFFNIRIINQEVYSLELLNMMIFVYPGLIQLICLLLDVLVKEEMDASCYFDLLSQLKDFQKISFSSKEINEKFFSILLSIMKLQGDFEINSSGLSFLLVEKKTILSYILNCVKLQQISWTLIFKIKNLITYIEKYEI